MPPLLETENKLLREQLAEIQSTLELLAKASSQSDEARALRQAVATKEKELVSSQLAMKVAQERLAELERAYSSAQLEIESLKKLASITRGQAEFLSQAKDVAKQATGNDSSYLRMIDRVNLDSSFPLEISKVLEGALRRLLGTTERGLKLHDLLTQARDSERLSDEALDLAHTIRRQRNILAHEQVDNRTHIGRVLLVLYASAILWPHLPE